MTWRNRAACLDEDPELFFPIGNTGPALLQIEEAKAVCRRCEVIETCLKWAIESGQDAGVWGGLSEDERRALNAATPEPDEPAESHCVFAGCDRAKPSDETHRRTARFRILPGDPPSQVRDQRRHDLGPQTRARRVEPRGQP